MGRYLKAPKLNILNFIAEIIILNAFPDTWIIRNEVGQLYLSWGMPGEMRNEHKIANEELFKFIPNGYYMKAEEILQNKIMEAFNE